jgi:hypothetical protein
MKWWVDRSSESKIGLLLIAGWVVPAVLQKFDEYTLLISLIPIIWIGVFFSNLHFIGEIRTEAERRGAQSQWKFYRDRDLLKDRTDPAWAAYFRDERFTSEEIDQFWN